MGWCYPTKSVWHGESNVNCLRPPLLLARTQGDNNIKSGNKSIIVHHNVRKTPFSFIYLIELKNIND